MNYKGNTTEEDTAPSGKPNLSEYLERMVQNLKAYATEHPKCTRLDILYAGYIYALENVYHGKINELKRELGIPVREAHGGHKPKPIS